jgi:hypothetical protein
MTQEGSKINMELDKEQQWFEKHKKIIVSRNSRKIIVAKIIKLEWGDQIETYIIEGLG